MRRARRGRGAAGAAALLLLTALAEPSHSGEPDGERPWVTYGAASGFGDWHVTDLLQDRDGVMWIGTEVGLYRFDGRSFVLEAAGGGAGSAYVVRLEASPRGGVWCLLQRDIGRRSGGAWRAAPLESPLLDMAVDSAGSVWGVRPDALFRLAEGAALPERLLWPGGPSASVVAGAQGALWIAVDGAVHRRDAGGGWRSWGPREGVVSERFRGIVQDGRGDVWILSEGHLLRGSGDVARFEDVTPPEATPPLLSLHPTTTGVFVGHSRGLLRLARDGTEALYREKGVRAIFQDRDGALWLGVRGVMRDAGAGLFRTHDGRSGLRDRPLSIFRDEDGTLFAGTAAGLFRARDHAWEEEAPLSGRRVFAIVKGPDGALWLGGAGTGDVVRYRPGDRSARRVPLPDGMEKTTTYALAFDRRGALWVGTSAGLYTSDGPIGAEEPVLRRKSLPGFAGAEVVRGVAVDPAGRVWIGAEHGLVVAEGDRLLRFGAADGLRQDASTFVVARRDGEVCTAYHELGVSCFRLDGGRLRDIWHLDAGAGLSANLVFAVGEDAPGRLWIGGARGADVVEGRRVIAHFSTANGLAADDVSANGILADGGGGVWISTPHGLSHFLGAPDVRPPDPRAVLVEAHVAGEPWAEGGPEPALAHGQGPIRLVWSVTAPVSASRLEQEVRLLGAPGDWAPRDERETLYTGLEAGSYTHEVRLRHPGGAWHTALRWSFSVAPPWWRTGWARAAAGAAALALIAAIFRARLALLRRRNARLEAVVRERTEQIERLHAQVVAAEKRATEEQMAGGFAHEIRNAVAGAKTLLAVALDAGGRSLLVENAEALAELFSRVREHLPPEERAATAALLRGVGAREARVNQVLHEADGALRRALAITAAILSYARLGQEQAGTETAPLGPLVESVVSRARPRLEAMGAALELWTDPQAITTVSEMHAQSIARNLVDNACDALEEHTGPRRLTVRVERTGDLVTLLVADTGPGLDEAARERVLEPFYTSRPNRGTGLGLPIVRRLVCLYGGTLEIGGAPGAGTTVTVRLPAAAAAP